MSDSLLLEAKGLSRRFGRHQAVDDVSFSLSAGDVLGFLGPNGAGKSTTMAMLTGCLSADAGRVLVGGFDVLRQPLAAKRLLGYLPEHPPLDEGLRVEEFLRFCGRIHGLAGKALEQALDWVLERCVLGSVRRRLIGQLSKGFQQRVGIAQAIVHRPPLVVLDEPTVGLDPGQMLEIRELIRDLGAEHAVVLSTHILTEVQAVCNRVQVLHHGRLVFSDRLLADGRLASADGQQAVALVVESCSESLLQRLRRVPAVLSVTPEGLVSGGQRLLVEHGADAVSALNAQLLAAVTQEGAGLLSLSPCSASLESVFIELTATDSARVARQEGLDDAA